MLLQVEVVEEGGGERSDEWRKPPGAECGEGITTGANGSCPEALMLKRHSSLATQRLVPVVARSLWQPVVKSVLRVVTLKLMFTDLHSTAIAFDTAFGSSRDSRRVCCFVRVCIACLATVSNK